jgi:hypothetical protein
MELPRYQYQESPTVRESLPGGTPQILPGAIERFGRELGGLAQERARTEYLIQASREQVQVAGIVSQLDAYADKWYEGIDAKRTPANTAEAYRKEAGEFTENLLGSIQGEGLRNRATAHVMAKIEGQAHGMRARANEMWVGATLADAKQQTQDAISRYAMAPNAEARGLIRQEVETFWQGLADYGVERPEQAQAIVSTFRSHAENAAFDHDAKNNPWQAKKDLSAGKYSLFTDQEKWAANTRATTRIREGDAQVDHEIKQADDALRVKFVYDLADGVYGRGKDVDMSKVETMLKAGKHEAATVEHILGLATAEKKREVVADEKGSKLTAASLKRRMDYTTADKIREAKSVAETDFAEGRLRREEFDDVQREYREQMEKLDKKVQAAKDDQTKQIEGLKDEATHEMLSWMPSKDDPLLFGIKGDLIQAEEAGRAIIAKAAKGGKDPVAAIREAKQSLTLRVYGTARSARDARLSDLEKAGLKPTKTLADDIERLRLPPEEKRRLKVLFNDAAELQQWMDRNPQRP